MSSASSTATPEVTAGGEIMLFGVRVKVDPMRKSVSLNNLSQYEQPIGKTNTSNHNESDKAVAVDESYASADDAVQHQSNSGRERKRGVPWTEEEHKLFLLGLQKVGKGDWRGISRNFVKTRTPTQVASHAQKYFIRRSNLNRRRRRSSLFDITTDSVSVMPIEQERSNQEIPVPPVPATTLPTVETTKNNTYPMASFGVAVGPIMLADQIEKPIVRPNPMMQRDQGNQSMLVHPVPMFSVSNPSTVLDLNLNQNSTTEPSATEPSSLSLRLSLSLDQGQASSTRQSAFRVMPGFSNGEISVA